LAPACPAGGCAGAAGGWAGRRAGWADAEDAPSTSASARPDRRRRRGEPGRHDVPGDRDEMGICLVSFARFRPARRKRLKIRALGGPEAGGRCLTPGLCGQGTARPHALEPGHGCTPGTHRSRAPPATSTPVGWQGRLAGPPQPQSGWRGRPNLGRVRLNLGRVRLNLGRGRLNLGRVRLPVHFNLGRVRLNLGRVRLNLGRVRQVRLNLGRGGQRADETKTRQQRPRLRRRRRPRSRQRRRRPRRRRSHLRRRSPDPASPAAHGRADGGISPSSPLDLSPELSDALARSIPLPPTEPWRKRS
jgi:hypothetical protein